MLYRADIIRTLGKNTSAPPRHWERKGGCFCAAARCEPPSLAVWSPNPRPHTLWAGSYHIVRAMVLRVCWGPKRKMHAACYQAVRQAQVCLQACKSPTLSRAAVVRRGTANLQAYRSPTLVLQSWSTEAMLATVASMQIINNSLQGRDGQQKYCQLASMQVTNSLLDCGRGHASSDQVVSQGTTITLSTWCVVSKRSRGSPLKQQGWKLGRKDAQCTKLHGKTGRMTLLPGISWLGHTNWKVLGPWLLDKFKKSNINPTIFIGLLWGGTS